MDWKKDIKLSDLLAHRRGDGDEAEEAEPFHQEETAPEAEQLPFHHGETDHEAPSPGQEPETGDPQPNDTSFWKREIRIGRRNAETETDPEFETSEDETEKRSFFTRSLGFERAKDAEPSETDVDSPALEREETAPFWKRELSFGRRRKEETPDTFEQDESEQTAEDLVEVDRLEKTPFWKREFAFGKRKDDAAAEEFDEFELEPTAQEVVEADVAEKTPFWRRELSFGRRRDDALSETPVEDEAAQAAEEQFESDQPERTPFWKREFMFGMRKDDAAAEALDESQSEPTAEDASEGDVAQTTPFWKRDLAFRRRKDDATPHAFEQDELEQPAEDAFESDVVEKTPFWKRELRFGRGKEVDELEADDDALEAGTEQATPFWKRELSFGRRKEDATADTPVEHEETASVESAPIDAAVPEPEPVDEVLRKDEADEDPDHGTQDMSSEPAVEHEGPAALEPEPVAASFAELEPVEEAPFTEEPSFASASAEAADHGDDAPFWKREIKFGRRRGDGDLAPPVGVPAPPSDEADMFTFTDGGPDFDTGGRRFWQRKPSFGRTKDELASQTDVDAPAGRKKGPFFKREFSFRRQKDRAHESFAGRAARGGRTKQLVGLKVGASQIAAARVVNNGSPELVQLARQPIEQGIVVGGELRDPDALAETLREFFAAHKLPNRNVRLGIGNNRIGVRSFEISGIHDHPKQLENAVRFRAQEALPIPLDEAVLDYHVIDESASPTGIRTYRVLLVVAYRELVDRYAAACRGAGLRLVGIDLEAFALLRALSPPPAEGLLEDTALVAVSIGHDRSTFAVSNGTVCEFTRVLDWGGSSLNTSIARALDVTPSQAEPVKRTLSLSDGEGGATDQTNEHTIRAEEAVRLELQTFARELVSSLHFYQNQPGSLAIGSIALTGGTAHLPGLAAELQRLIGVKVRVGDPLRRVKTGKRVETPAQIGSMTVAIGLGIED